mgnify:CR=1 FL=1|tara:strand:- start:53491 stop:54330 length:840 start_codon:yes stop_codon:yes gene_type:complete
MSTARTHVRGFLSVALIAFALVSLVGCVGPMACPPGVGCDSGCGSLAQGCGGNCNGCGELYIDPWINHPADVCDPCDVCGNHNGQSCGKCRSVFDGVATMWGYRCGNDCGCDDNACDAGPCPGCGGAILNAVANVARAVVTCGTCGQVDCGCDVGCDACGEVMCGCEVGCDTCGEVSCGCEATCGVEVGCGIEAACGIEAGCGFETGCPSCGEVTCGCDGGAYGLQSFPAGNYIQGEPTPIRNEVVETAPAAQPYKPSRTRKIFRARPDIAEAPKSINY